MTSTNHRPVEPVTIDRAAVVGCGVIGAAWASRMLLNGIDVAVSDPSPDAETMLVEVLANAISAYDDLGLPTNRQGSYRIAASVADAVRDAQFVQESTPERPDIKAAVLAEIEAGAAPDTVIGSSTSGIRPSIMQQAMTQPARLVVGHPFNPVYLLPVVEVVGGEHTTTEVIDRALGIYTGIGMRPIHVKVEIDAFVGDRLLEALWREALWLVNDGVATTQEIDDIITHGFGLRWAQMGLFETYRIAGGLGGMRHFLGQFGPTLDWPYSKLTNTPDYTTALVDKIADQSDAQSGQHSIRELEQMRDRNLVGFLKVLEANRWGAGTTIAAQRQTGLAARHDPRRGAVVIGGANVDLKARSTAAAAEHTSNPGRGSMTPGGVGRNIAENIARLGDPVHLISVVGRDPMGDSLLDHTAAAGVRVDHVTRTDHATGTYTAVLDTDGELIIAISDMDAIADLDSARLDAARDVIANADVVVVDGNLGLDAFNHALDLSAGVRTIFDPVSVPKATLLREALDERVYAVTPNRDELGALTDLATDSDHNVREAAQALHERGIELVWVRLGERGSMLSHADGTVELDALATEVEDITGAGDSMLGAFCHVLLNGGTPLEAARFGHAAAAATIASAHTVRLDLTPQLVQARLDQEQTS